MNDFNSTSGLVAQVVSDREVILNKGISSGLQENDYVVVIDPQTLSIPDPETGEELGGLKRIKAVLRVAESTENLSLAKTFRTKRVRTGGGFGLTTSLNDMMSSPRYETRVETLKFDPQAGLPIDENDSVISVGDPFETIPPEEAEDTKTVTLWR